MPTRQSDEARLVWVEREIPERFSGVIFPPQNGIRQAIRPTDGTLVAMAYARYETDEAHELVSPVYELVEAADPAPFSQYSGAPFGTWQLSQEAVTSRATAAAVARAAMTPEQKSPLDMIQICQELAHDAAYAYKEWEREQQRLMEEHRADLEAIELYRKWERGRALVEAEKKKEQAHHAK